MVFCLLVFLLPLVTLLPDWLPPLQRLFRARESAGAAAARILTFDGALLHAGGDLLADGSVSARRGGPPDAPGYAFVRPVGCGSPLLLATPKGVFGSGPGFSGDRPSTLTIDYCLWLREQGYGVYYQPETVAVLLERTGSTLSTPSGSSS